MTDEIEIIVNVKIKNLSMPSEKAISMIRKDLKRLNAERLEYWKPILEQETKANVI